MSNKTKRKITDFKADNFPFLPLLCFIYMFMKLWIFEVNISPLEGFPGGSVVKNKNKNHLPRRCKRPGLYPWVRRSPGEWDGNPLQYSCLENLMDRRAWQAMVHGFAKSWAWLKRFSTHPRIWTVVLEKALESPLDCKEIQPVHPKGNQSWIFNRRTDGETETPILWPPDARNWLIWKDLDAGKNWRQEEKGMTEDEMAGWHHRLNEHEFE